VSKRTFLFGTMALLTLMCVGLLALYGAGEEGLRVVVRATARTSIVLFCAAFAATGLRRRWRAPLSAWLVRCRRQVGLAFAYSHFLHLGAILGLVFTVPSFAPGVSPVTVIGGGTGYLLIAAMAATSNDAAVKRLGMRRWRALHLTGLWVVFAIFANSYLGRAFSNPNYIPPAALLVAALVLRLLPTRARVARVD
jgi:DMSO/TMAO reductase YedYZ heme-binding membrane subunit